MSLAASVPRAAIVAVLAAVGCARSHDLGVGTTTAGSGGAGTTSAATTGSGGAPTTAGAGGAPVEPSGPTALTVVNGLNDYSAARFCFLPGDAPWPAAAAGLPFAAGQAVDLATALPPGVDVTPWVIAGDLSATAGKTCSEMLALAQPGDGGTTPSVLAAPLGVIPQAVLASDRSLLLVPIGCMGGAGHDDPSQANGCGATYTVQTPTVSAVLLAMSRIPDPDHISLQVVSASVVIPTSDVRVKPGLATALEADVAPSLSPGGIGPSPPFHELALSGYAPLGAAQIKTYPPGGFSATSVTMLSDVLGASAVGTSGFATGASLVLVAVGAAPGAPAGPFWHKLTYAVVQADPGP